MDISHTVIPKSDQLNADDLIAGSRTITITRVSANPDAPEQPVSVYFEGDERKPYKPCKSMRRVMISAWGTDASKYAGRSMTLYRDSTVKFGGMEVGGIRISHMSHIEKDMVMALTESKARRKPFKVLAMPSGKRSGRAKDDPPADVPGIDLTAAQNRAREVANKGRDAFASWWKSEEGAEMRDACADIMGELRTLTENADKAKKEISSNDDEIPL